MEVSTSAGPVASKALLALRLVATAHAVAIFGQPVFAGVFLSGDYDMLRLHATGADVVFYLALVQLVAAMVLWWRRGVRWPSAVALLIVLGETGQYSAGLSGDLELHIPLGVALVALTIVSLFVLWRPEVAR
ncbi:hypothetical protein A8924_2224 [Saccharopolyspora erythraea NRRL 2338]|uniref:Uncharacterized protein n=2 Tax=Saccharopolyspora erythraea TaxID=1836 RepID=A4FAR1_SACEN|nr:hypothetical protein [Saccharopolyspora erythraea]EQD82565.1 hypothetical protein N599_29970 [Saccharopolyspora erythraea D]PFG94921.1 hypothetical protein A8924_2224 [Saccharopolyspora erythraea NRRL 2338]QRK91618.1 hypothetical protein JQX30_09675 [Saccharopolyspora erythraea]CAM01136.1 hypothetical protein SACE_1821 [Saccharopolyspora erythraea NRRL 2338]